MSTPADLALVCEAGMPFVRRLLLMGDDGPYRRLALSVLASFASDATLAARTDFGVCSSGLLDLGALASLVLADGVRSWSLAELCERVLNKALSKSNQLRCSDWEASALSAEQALYAAKDA